VANDVDALVPVLLNQALDTFGHDARGFLDW